jgi:4-amino-4-deoxy-L-arabinose transferase-like glycosyltransferase
MFKNRGLITWLKKRWRGCIVLLLACAFCWFSASFNHLAQTPDFIKWTSPDETANYLMAKQLAQTGKPMFLEKDNLLFNGLLKPRSFQTDGIWLKPISFLGIIVYYGLLAKIFGITILPFITPFLAGLGLIFYYLLIKKLFNKNNAFISTLLLATFPVYIYYSARSMFHNIPFVVFLIIGFYLLILSNEKTESTTTSQKCKLWFYALLAGFACGISFTMRTSELLWLVPAMGLAWLFNLKRFGLMKPILFGFGVFFAMLPIFYFNDILFGSMFASGYQNLNSSVSTIVSGSGKVVASAALIDFDQAKTFLKQVYHSFFFFGFKPALSWNMFNLYLIKMFPWLWALGVAGLIIFCFKFWRRPKSDLVYLLFFITSAVILVLYYGSWKIMDNTSLNAATIGNSYTRYWLPIYLMFLPFVSLALIRLPKIFIFPPVAKGARWGFILLIAVAGLTFVLIGSEEGLMPTLKRQQASKQELQQLLKSTEANSVIITRYGDKLLFPERRVVVDIFNNQTINPEYTRVVKKFPVYYYNFTFSQDKLNELNNNDLKNLGLVLIPKNQFAENITLYSLKPLTK